MTKTEAWTLLLTAFGWFGGGAAITIALAGYLSKLLADRSIERHKWQLNKEMERLKGELAKETETHKLILKKKEILYQKQIEAASAYISMHRLVEPKYRYPDMEWDEALDDVVDSFSTTEGMIRAYISNYGAALSSKNRIQLDKCMLLASNNQYAKHEGDHAVKDAKSAAEEMLTLMKEIEERFIQEVQS
jgi:hypothetical protein